METNNQTSFVASAKDVGAIVRMRRAILRLSQEQLADLSGVGRRYIVDLEAGKETVQANLLFKVCAAVDVEFLACRPTRGDIDVSQAMRRARFEAR